MYSVYFTNIYWQSLANSVKTDQETDTEPHMMSHYWKLMEYCHLGEWPLGKKGLKSSVLLHSVDRLHLRNKVANSGGCF